VLFILHVYHTCCLSYVFIYVLFILHVYRTFCLSYILSILRAVYPTYYHTWFYPTYCLSKVLFILHVVNHSCCLFYMFIVHVIYPIFCLSYMLFTLMWFITCGVCPTLVYRTYCLSHMFILHLVILCHLSDAIYSNRWAWRLGYGYVETVHLLGFILPTLWHRKFTCQRPLCCRDMVALVMALDVIASDLYCRDFQWNVSYCWTMPSTFCP
jgi:hypothetical protein